MQSNDNELVKPPEEQPNLQTGNFEYIGVAGSLDDKPKQEATSLRVERDVTLSQALTPSYTYCTIHRPRRPWHHSPPHITMPYSVLPISSPTSCPPADAPAPGTAPHTCARPVPNNIPPDNASLRVRVQFAPLPSDILVATTFSNSTGLQGKRYRKANRHRRPPTRPISAAKTLLHPNKQSDPVPLPVATACPITPSARQRHSHGTRLTNTMFLIKVSDIPNGRKATYLRVVAALQPEKANPRRVRWTAVGGDCIDYPNDVKQ